MNTMRNAVALLWTLGAASALAQAPQTGLKRTAKPPVVTSSTAPVTRAEAGQIFSRASKLLAPVLGLTPTPSALTGTAPVTRDQVVAEMNRLFEWSRPKFVFSPRRVTHNPAVFTVGQPQRGALGKLVSFGAIAPLGPLATSPRPTLTVREFGDAMGFFISRLCDLTHTPSRFSPQLMPDE
jgi:hypothetical protein